MNTTATIIGIVVVVIILAVAYIYLSAPSVSGAQPQSKTVFTISDAPAVGAVSSVNMQVQSVSVQSAATGQWYPVQISTTGNYNLTALKGSYAIMGNATLPIGTYDQVMMKVGSVAVTYANGTTQTAVMPNNTVTVKGSFDVASSINTNSTNWINVDVNSAESLHATASGRLVILPVVQVVAWSNAQLKVQANNMVSVQNYGAVTATVNSGMSVNGTMQANLVVPQSTNLTILGNGSLGIGVG